jgi:hypothetical protein
MAMEDGEALPVEKRLITSTISDDLGQRRMIRVGIYASRKCIEREMVQLDKSSGGKPGDSSCAVDTPFVSHPEVQGLFHLYVG